MKNFRPANILLIEDSPGEFQLAQKAFQEGNYNARPVTASQEAEVCCSIQKTFPPSKVLPLELVCAASSLPEKGCRKSPIEVNSNTSLHYIPAPVFTLSNEKHHRRRPPHSQRECTIYKPLEPPAKAL